VLKFLNHLKTKHYTWLVDILILFLLLFLFYIIGLASYPLFTPDEGRYSEIAREMFITRDYITPRLNGIIFLDKPILHYWLQSIMISLFGIKDWSLRLLPLLSGIIGCLITYICGLYLFDRRIALLASAILATSPLYFISAHYSNLDLEVAVWISASLLCFITSMNSQTKKKVFFILMTYVFSALAVLTKGLIGIVIPLFVSFIWLVAIKRISDLKKFHLIAGSLIFFLNGSSLVCSCTNKKSGFFLLFFYFATFFSFFFNNNF